MADADALARAAGSLGVELDAERLERFMRYAALVNRWRAIANLTTAATPERFLREHVVDCLSLVPHVPGPRVLDVGSGAGLPGIVLAIANPALDIALLEPRAKRARFLTQARIELGLERVAVVSERVEAHSPVAPYDDIVTRALGPFAGFVRATRHLHAPGTRLTAMKARFDAAEFDASSGVPDAAPAAAVGVSVIPLTVPGYRDRCLVTLCPVPGESHEAAR